MKTASEFCLVSFTLRKKGCIFSLDLNQESLEEKGKKKKKNTHNTKKQILLEKNAESSLNTGFEFPLYQSGICFTTENKSRLH